MFSFAVTAKPVGGEKQNLPLETLVGLVRQDERRDTTDVEFFSDAGERQQLFRARSDALVTLRSDYRRILGDRL